MWLLDDLVVLARTIEFGTFRSIDHAPLLPKRFLFHRSLSEVPDSGIKMGPEVDTNRTIKVMAKAGVYKGNRNAFDKEKITAEQTPTIE